MKIDAWPARNAKSIAIRKKAVDVLWLIGEDGGLPAVVCLEARRLAHIIGTGGFTYGFRLAVDNDRQKQTEIRE